uniref:Uncharacterized protein n=1 Tax=Arundo donax TaxID=35708 RepID=A0A0A9GER7_ARUDO
MGCFMYISFVLLLQHDLLPESRGPCFPAWISLPPELQEWFALANTRTSFEQH